MRWFLGCSNNKRTDIVLSRQSIEAFVSSKHVSSDTPIVLFVEVYQDVDWSHRALLISSSSLRVDWVNTNREDLGVGIRTTYQYRLHGEDGSHIINSISLQGQKKEESETLSTDEIFVDIGGEKQSTKLQGVVRKEEFSWYWMIAGVGGTMLGWYLLRRETLQAAPPTREEIFRSDWGVFIQQERDAQKRAMYLSSLLRGYLGERFGIELEKATPKEARDMVEQADWPQPVCDAALRIFVEIDAIRFAGIQADDEVFAELGRSLEVIFTVGYTS